MPSTDPETRRARNRAYYLAHREHLIEQANAWNIAHPEEHKAGQRRWYESKGREYRAANRDRMNVATERWRQANPANKSASLRAGRLRRLYGLTVGEYEGMLAAQNGVCAVCGKIETHRDRNGETVRLAVDHDHVTGSVRALLCHSCNTGIGSFYDDPTLLLAAVEYINRFRR
jgi:hypothetical protein